MALQYDIGKRIIDKMAADTSPDDALRAAVERVTRAPVHLTTLRGDRCDEAAVQAEMAGGGVRLFTDVTAADLRLILSALTATGEVSKEMVEAGARVIAKDFALSTAISGADEWAAIRWRDFADVTRAVLAAAGGGK